VPPAIPAVPVPQVAPVPEIKRDVVRDRGDQVTEQIRTCRPETPVTISVVVADVIDTA
jgi:hypothetical protein